MKAISIFYSELMAEKMMGMKQNDWESERKKRAKKGIRYIKSGLAFGSTRIYEMKTFIGHVASIEVQLW